MRNKYILLRARRQSLHRGWLLVGQIYDLMVRMSAMRVKGHQETKTNHVVELLPIGKAESGNRPNPTRHESLLVLANTSIAIFA
jgi:hypothetical protein